MTEEAKRIMDRIAGRPGWKVEVGTRDGLVKVVDDGLVYCIDERNDPTGVVATYPGPKIPGGVYGVAGLAEKKGTADGLLGAVQRVLGVGLKPSTHRDCGLFKKWTEGVLTTFPTLEVPHGEATQLMRDLGVQHVDLHGPHNTRGLRINTVRGTTHNPDGRTFHLDVWAAEDLGIHPDNLVDATTETIELLGGERSAEIIW